MSDPIEEIPAASLADLETAGLIESIISRAERILARDLTEPYTQVALTHLAQDKTVAELLKRAKSAKIPQGFNVDISE